MHFVLIRSMAIAPGIRELPPKNREAAGISRFSPFIAAIVHPENMT